MRRAGRADEPRDGRQGPVHRVCGRGGDVGSPLAAALGGVPERRPGVHARPSASTWRARCTTTSCPSSWTTRARCGWATRWRSRPTSGRWCRRRSGRRSRRSLEAAVGAGAEVLVGGDRAGFERGHYLAPTVVTGAPDSTALLREETFGPVAPIVPVDSLDEAIRLANGTRFGLGANVYTRDLETAVRCMREIKAGTVWINDPLTDNDAGPFGGMKQSGLRPRARTGGSRGVPGDQARPHRDEDRAEGLVVPVRALTGASAAARASATENAASSSTRTSPPPRSSTSRSAKTQIARSSVATSAFLAFAITFLVAHGGPLRASPTLASGRPAPSSDAARWTSRSLRTSGKMRRPGRSPCSSSCSASASVSLQVSGHERIREVVGARRGVGGGEPLDVGDRDVRRRVEREADLLELARQPLLARADPGHQLLGRLRVELEAELPGVPDAPLRQLPRLGRRVLARLAAGLLDGFGQLLDGLATRDQDEDGVRRQLAEGLLERAELRRLPGAHVVHQQVAGRGVEAEHRERPGHLGRLALARVEGLEAARAPLRPRRAFARGRARRRSWRRRRRRRGRRASARPRPRVYGRAQRSRQRSVATRMVPWVTVSVTVPSRSVR